MNRSSLLRSWRPLAFLAVAFYSGTVFAGPVDSLVALAEGLDPLFRAAKDMASTLVPVGYTFLSIALLLEVFSLVTQFWIKGGASDAVAAIFRVVLVTSIPFAMLASWPELPNRLLGGFTSEIAGVVTGSHGDATAQISATITSISNAVTDGLIKTQDPSGNVVVRAILDALVAIVLFLPLMLLIVALLFALFGPLIILYVGVIVGPILVPWMAWKPLESFGMKWFSFMVSAGMAFVVGLIMATLITTALTEFGTVMGNAATDGAAYGAMAYLAGLIPMVAMMVFCGYMMLKCEQIGGALVGGPSIGGGGLFGAAMLAGKRGGGGGGAPKSAPPPPKSAPPAPNRPASPPKPGSSGSSGTADAGSGSQSSLSQQAGSASSSSGARGESSSSPQPGRGSSSGGDGSGSGNAPSSGAMAATAGKEGGSGAADAGASGTSDSEKGGGAGSASTSRFAGAGKAASSVIDAGRSVGSKVMNSQTGKAVAVGAAAVAAGPVGALAAGAYAVSPRMRAATDKALGKVSGKLSGANKPEKPNA